MGPSVRFHSALQKTNYTPVDTTLVKGKKLSDAQKFFCENLDRRIYKNIKMGVNKEGRAVVLYNPSFDPTNRVALQLLKSGGPEKVTRFNTQYPGTQSTDSIMFDDKGRFKGMTVKSTKLL